MLTGRWVLLSPERLRRPTPPVPTATLPKRSFRAILVQRHAIAGTRDYLEVHKHLYPAVQPFAPGPAKAVLRADDVRPGVGTSYVLRFASRKDLVEANARHRAAFTKTLTELLSQLQADRRVVSAVVFRNHGLRSGASLTEPHHQLWGIPVPSAEELLERAWVKTQPRCPTCALLRINKKFVIAIGPHAVLLARPAARFGAELAVLPRQHIRSFTELSTAAQADVVRLLALGVRRLRATYGDAGINEVWQERGVRNQRLHFRIELLPRLNMMAGLELGTGIFLNPYLPERVAKQLRALRKI